MSLNEWLELAAIFVASLAGGLAAVRKHFDLFGVIVVGWVTGLGGGVLRDLIIGAIPPVGVSQWKFVLAAILGGLGIFFFHPDGPRMRRSIIVLDAWALGMFVLVGTIKGLQYNVGWLAAMMAGALTGIGGGVFRDLLVGEIPLVLSDRQFYAVPALLGAGVTALLWELGLLGIPFQAAIVLLIAGFRLVALQRHWVIPTPDEHGFPHLRRHPEAD